MLRGKMLRLIGAYYERREKALHEMADRLFDTMWPMLSLALKTMMEQSTEVHVEGPRQDQRQTVVTTRRGVRVVVGDEEVCIYGQREMIQAKWEVVPGILASLRTALVPAPRQQSVLPGQAETALEIASGFAGDPEEVLFTVEDAKDITEAHRVLLDRCPDQAIAREIAHLQRVGSRKLFRYIETELVSQ